MASVRAPSSPGAASPNKPRLLQVLYHHMAAMYYPASGSLDRVGLVIYQYGAYAAYIGRRSGTVSVQLTSTRELETFLAQEGLTSADPAWTGVALVGRRSVGRLVWRPEQQAYFGIIAEGAVVRVDVKTFQVEYPLQPPEDNEAYVPDVWLFRLIMAHTSGITLVPFHSEDFGVASATVWQGGAVSDVQSAQATPLPLPL